VRNTELTQYYERRAAAYEQVYAKPERQADLRRLQTWVAATFHNCDVLEIAAGTGYWTQFVAQNAGAVLATDYNLAPLHIAARHNYPRKNVRFGVADAFALDTISGTFNASFAGFWWSHIPREDLDRFLAGLCARLLPGSLVAVIDNRYVVGSSQPIQHIDSAGNTYQLRRLSDGTEHQILKNFPTTDQLQDAADRHGTNCQLTALDYYWTMTFYTHDQT